MSNIFSLILFVVLVMSFDLEDSFLVFLKKLRQHNLFVTAFDIQENIIETYEKKGLSREQVFELRLGDIWHYIGTQKNR